MSKSIFEGYTIYSRKDGTFVVDGYHVCPKSIDPMGKYDIEELKSYLVDHPEALVPEPTPPAPTPEVLEASAEAQRQALFREYDTAIMMLTRASRLGDATAAGKIAQWDAYAVQLQELNDTEGWYIDTVWPTKPIL